MRYGRNHRAKDERLNDGTEPHILESVSQRSKESITANAEIPLKILHAAPRDASHGRPLRPHIQFD